jgi:hypothetical protein
MKESFILVGLSEAASIFAMDGWMVRPPWLIVSPAACPVARASGLGVTDNGEGGESGFWGRSKLSSGRSNPPLLARPAPAAG